MRTIPMLASNLDPKKIVDYCSDADWWMEQKLDGVRMLLVIDDGKAHATNRRGDTVPIHPKLALALEDFEGQWVFDGEWIGGKLEVFDMPLAMDYISPSSPFEERREALEAIFDVAFGDNTYVELVKTAKETHEKLELVEWAIDNNVEGVMIKDRKGVYSPGKRMPTWLKAKFTKTADCILLEVRREGKLSSSVGLFRDDKIVDVGSVKMKESDLDKASPGDVVEIRYLYLGAGERLYQPVFLGFRNDKSPEECTFDQLQTTNKEVRAGA